VTPNRWCAAIGAVLLLWGTVAPAQTVERQRLSLEDVELHDLEQGRGEPLILLHGGQGDYGSWEDHIGAFASSYRVFSYSRRYHYPNDNPIAANHSALVDAADLAALIDKLHLGSVHLVGTSYGALTALALAVSHPTVVRTLVLAEPPVHAWADSPRGVELFREFMTTVHEPARAAFDAGDDETAMRIFIDAFDGTGTFARLSEMRRAGIMRNSRFFKALTASSDPFPNLPKEAVAQLRMPVLVIRGENTDALHRLVTEEVEHVLPRSQRAVIPQAGHGSPRQNPRAFIAAVLDFLDAAGSP
jgi:pimeloyl-ACP methyl ester carboxylesterase